LATAADSGKSAQLSPAAAAFERMKTLVGEWKTTNSSMQASLTYELAAGGSALVERDTPEGITQPMITVYYLDGDRILLTHYCMAGNQPRMQARRFENGPGELNFEFLDVTNLAGPNAGHMHDARIRLLDDKHFTASWRFFQNGQPARTEDFQYVRVK
jgi:hypothetical protein